MLTGCTRDQDEVNPQLTQAPSTVGTRNNLTIPVCNIIIRNNVTGAYIGGVPQATYTTQFGSVTFSTSTPVNAFMVGPGYTYIITDPFGFITQSRFYYNGSTQEKVDGSVQLIHYFGQSP